MTREFRFHAPTAIFFGVGQAQKVADHARRFGMRHVFLVTDPGLLATGIPDDIRGHLADAGLAVTLYSDVDLDPDAGSIRRGAAALRASAADGLVAVGGGSAMDSAKAFAVLAADDSDDILAYAIPNPTRAVPPIAPLICLPTTSGTGSEVTPVAVVTDPDLRIKKSLSDAAIAPRVALIDPLLTLSMPPRLTASTGMDALAHALEAMTTVFANPLADALAVSALDLVGRYLVRAVENGGDLEARSGMSQAALLAGLAFPSGLLHLGHAAGHALGTRYHLPHGLACTVSLGPALDFIRPAVEPQLAKAGRALAPACQYLAVADNDAPAMVAALYERLGLPGLGAAAGVGPADLPDLADWIMREERLIVRSPIKPGREDWVRILEASL